MLCAIFLPSSALLDTERPSVETHKFLTLIPARYGSSRFPGKPLAHLGETSVIGHLWHNLCGEGGLEDAFVVTDDSRVEAHVREFGGRALRVDVKAPTGSDRIYRCYKSFFRDRQVDFILNVQGDGPLLQAQDIRALVSFHAQSSFDITTLVKRETDDREFAHPHRVKVAYTQATGKCHYFSRSPIAFRGPEAPPDWFHHLGVYCFCPKALERMGESPPSPLELCEGLEQLRVLEMGMSIGALEVSIPWVSIDGPEDLKRAEEMVHGRA